MELSGIVNTAEARASAMNDVRIEAELTRFREVLETTLAGIRERDEAERVQLRKAAEMFEAYFLQLMFREMRRTTFNEQGLFPKSNAERIFTEMLDEEVANTAARGGGIGLADMIYRQMTRDFF